MKHRHLDFLVLLWLVVTFVGCDVHQWPDPYEPDPEPVYPELTIPVGLEYETEFYVWEHLYDPMSGVVRESNPTLNLFPDYPGTSSMYTNVVPDGRQQVCVKAFPASDPSRCVGEQAFVRDIDGSYDTEFNLDLQGSNTYDVVVWTQLLAPSQTAPFYDASDFGRVHIVADNYNGNTDYRDGFSGRIRVDADTEINGRYVIRMKRPMGKFELVTTDLSEFLDRETKARGLSTRAKAEDYRVIISFPMYYPSSYSVIDDRLENASTGVSFETRMTVTGDSEASLGFEYVMLNNIAENAVQTRVDVYRLDGTHVAGSTTFTIPMRRDHHTLLRGAFLADISNGGVGIDPGFNGDHNVTWQ